MRTVIVSLLNRLTANKDDEEFEWTNSKIALVLVFWIWGLFGAGIFFYGIYSYEFQQLEEDFRFIPIGVVIMVSGNLIAVVIRKIINRKRNLD